MFLNKKVIRGTGTFTNFAKATAWAAGQPWTFSFAFGVIVFWGITGPMFRFSDTWQLVINTGTTIVTFLMVFLIQNTQNRDSQAIQIKLDELIRASEGAHTAIMDLEQLTDKELGQIKKAYSLLAEDGREHLRKGTKDTNTPEVVFEAFGNKPSP